MAIYQWAMASGNRNCSPAYDIRVLRSKLQPTFRAKVFANGVRVMRPDRGKKREYIAGLRYMGPRIEQTGMRERARRGEEIFLDLSLDPYEPDRASFSDEKGFHELINVDADPIMRREATLADYLAHQDDENLQELLTQNVSDQTAFDYANHRSTKNLEHREAKKAAIERTKESGEKVNRKSLKTGLQSHRVAEAGLLKDQLDLVNPSRRPAAAKPKVAPAAAAPAHTSTAAAPSSAEAPPPSDAQSAVRRYREMRKAA